MAEEVGSLAVRVGLDTAEFNRGIKELGQRSRILGQEFRNAAAGLDRVGDAAEISRLNITRLTGQIGEQREITDRLRTAHANAANQYGETSTQAQAYELRLVRAEGTLQSMERNLVTANSQLAIQSSRWTALGNAMQGASERLGAIGEKMKGVGEKMSMAVTAPIVAAGGAMLKGAVDAENAQNKLQASLGITAEEADKLGNVATEVWKDAFGSNIEEVGAAIITVRKNMGNLADTELKTVTEGAMTIADVFGAEVADSTKAAGTMMENFGISGQDALDLITVGFQKGGDYSGELLDTLNEYAPQFSSMGLTADQAMGILVAGANAGSFSLDKVGDAMKEFNLRAQDGSKSTSEGFTAIGLDAQKMGAAIAKGGEDGQKAFTATITALAAMKDPMAQNTAGTALFGSQWEDVRAKVIVAMADGMKGVGDFKGATDTATKAMYDNNPGAALTSAMRELQAAIGPALLPLASIITNDIVPAFKSLADSFNNLSPEGQKVALAVAGIAAAIGPVLVIVGTLISSVGAIAGAFGAASGAIAAAGGIIAAIVGIITSPITLTIAAIAALAAIAFVVVKNWEPIKEFFSNLWTSITTTTAVAWEGIKTFFGQIPGAVSNFLGATVAVITQFGSDIITWVATEIPLFINNFMTFMGELPGKIGYALGFALGTIVKFGIDAVNWVIAEVPKIITGIVSFFAELPGKIGNLLGLALGEIVGWGVSAASWASVKVPEIIGSVVSYFSQLPGRIGNALSGALTSLVNWFTNMGSTVATQAPRVTGNIISAFASLPGKMLSVGGDIVRGLWNGMSNMAGWLASKVRDFAGGILRGMKDALDIKSPSRVMRDEVGLMMGAGVADGIEKSQGLVTKAMNGLSRVAVAPSSSSTTNQIRNTETITNTNSVIVQNMYVRSENDIKLIAKELYSLQRGRSRGQGVTA